jgi:hypothetical protein
MTSRRPPLPPGFYEGIAAELEEIADRLEQRPELNHGAAEKLRKIAKAYPPVCYIAWLRCRTDKLWTQKSYGYAEPSAMFPFYEDDLDRDVAR